jgi:hypothetical protein
MPRAVFFVQTQAASPDRAEEYHQWYDHTHIPQLCAIPGIVSARRFDLVGTGRGPADPSIPQHAAIYEIEADDVDAVMAEMAARAADGRTERSNALQLDPPPVTLLYVERA